MSRDHHRAMALILAALYSGCMFLGAGGPDDLYQPESGECRCQSSACWRSTGCTDAGECQMIDTAACVLPTGCAWVYDAPPCPSAADGTAALPVLCGGVVACMTVERRE